MITRNEAKCVHLPEIQDLDESQKDALKGKPKNDVMAIKLLTSLMIIGVLNLVF